MSESVAGARKMLERQLEELGSLYNAGVRSPVFREWRQATLTCIQRIWPAEPAKSERFRRIPFSAPMGRPAEREVREYFERGCGEASGLLKDLIQEVATVGLGAGAGPSHPAMAPLPGSDDDAYPNLELPGPQSGAAPAGPPKPRLKDLLGFTDAPLDSDAPVVAPPQASPASTGGAPPLPHAPAPAQPAGGPAPFPQAPDPAAAAPMPAMHTAPPAPGAAWATAEPVISKPPASSGANAPPGHDAPGPVKEGTFTLADLESHGFFAPPAAREAAPSMPASPAAAAAPHAPPPRLVVTGAQPAPSPETPAPPAPTTDRVAPTIDPMTAAARALEEAARGADPSELERIAEELLRASSSLSAVPRRTGQDRRANARELQSAVATAIAALALEVEALGVPDGHRARARAVLLDLSRRLDAPNLPWGTLREAIGFVMEFPALGRRVLPLLLPYLDRAA